MLDRSRIIELTSLRNRSAVFRDRRHAGEILADLLGEFQGSGARVLAIPAGGVPVAVAVARRLGLTLDIAVVSKITLPWTTEAGYGAVAFDGSVQLNRELIEAYHLDEATVEKGIAITRAKVNRRIRRFRGDAPIPDLASVTMIAIDDGLASGYTMLATIEALHHAGARRIIVAVPTGHHASVQQIAGACDAVFCANLRDTSSFAVADAYQHWTDVDEEAALSVFHEHHRSS